MSELTILVSTWGDGLFAIRCDGPTHELANQRVTGLAPNGSGALAIVDGHALRSRAPNGDWVTIALSGAELSCCMVVGDVVYVGTNDARMLRLAPQWGHQVSEGIPRRAQSTGLEFIDGFDRVPGRDTWFAGSALVNGQRLGPPLGIRSVAANADGSVLFANVHVGGIPRSTDGGKTWHPTIEINSDIHQVCGHPTDSDLVFAVSALGLCISCDAGATWTIERDGLHDPHCYAIACSGDDLIFSGSPDFFGQVGQIYRRPAKPDGPIVPVDGGRPGWLQGITDTGCIAASGSAVAVADRAGNLYVSEDFGWAWTLRGTGLAGPSGVFVG
jgi:hypothetical protein